MDEIYPILLGVVQGITEFLPVSSSAHLVLISHLYAGAVLPLRLNIGLHIGTLLAVFIFFWRDWWQLIQGSYQEVREKKPGFYLSFFLPSLLIGTLPAGVIGIIWQKDIEATFHNPVSIAWPLMIVGILLWWTDKFGRKSQNISNVTIKTGVYIGLAQALALIPGVSRSGITMAAGRLLGFTRKDAAKYAFLLGAPAMAGAAILNAPDIAASLHEPEFQIGLVTSVVVGCLAIKFLLSFMERFGLAAFAIYRLVLGILILFFIGS